MKKNKSILNHVHKHRLKYISVLPSFITILNAIAGFAAITIASRGFQGGVIKFELPGLSFTNFGLAGLMIFLGMIADMLDGRVARMSNSTSSFGGQLDSLCDVVSFGIAPAFLAFQYLTYELEHLVRPPLIVEGLLFRLVWLSCVIYLSCAVIRLARFNVENEEDESSHMKFAGLPSPAAAGAVICLIVFIQDLYVFPGPEIAIYGVAQSIVVCILPIIVIASGLLMISRVSYPHLINQYLRGKRPLTHLVWALVAIAIIWCSLSAALVIAFLGFAVFGVIRTLGLYLRNKKQSKATS